MKKTVWSGFEIQLRNKKTWSWLRGIEIFIRKPRQGNWGGGGGGGKFAANLAPQPTEKIKLYNCG
jgi:hypothetical protein